jgi:hypothetical protein
VKILPGCFIDRMHQTSSNSVPIIVIRGVETGEIYRRIAIQNGDNCNSQRKVYE